MVNVAVIGCGYWGPNLIRNFSKINDTNLSWICDVDKDRLEEVSSQYPGVKTTTEISDILMDTSLDGVAIATPVGTHYTLAKACLEKGKHVLIEKPLCSSLQEGEHLVALANKNKLRLMCDHTFCYTGVVRKIREVILNGELGKLLYFDSVRINLGLFQRDVNVIWDLAPHDIYILDFLLEQKPIAVSAHGVSHSVDGIENMAYLSLQYDNSFMSHVHVNWLSPVKIRQTIIGGDERMLVWNDMDPAEKIKIYDKGVEIQSENREDKHNLLWSYRSGDMYAPRFDQTEALTLVAKEFADCINENRPAMSDGESGLRTLKVLVAADRSIKTGGGIVKI